MKPKKGTSWVAVVGFGVLAFIVLGIIAGKIRTSSTTSAPGEQPAATSRTQYITPHEDSLISERFTVNAGTFFSRDFTITAQMEDARLAGRFEASGGSGADIQVCVATADEFRNWINGNEAKVFYGRKATIDSFNVGPLPPGKYTIGFSNKQALLFSRNVTAEVTLRYKTREYR